MSLVCTRRCMLCVQVTSSRLMSGLQCEEILYECLGLLSHDRAVFKNRDALSMHFEAGPLLVGKLCFACVWLHAPLACLSAESHLLLFNCTTVVLGWTSMPGEKQNCESGHQNGYFSSSSTLYSRLKWGRC